MTAASLPATEIAGSIILIGPMGAGKSAVGRTLASATRHRFADTDRLVVQRAGRRIPEIFADSGEAAFRALEREALLELHGWSRLVVATGGGIVETAANLPTLREMGCVIWLRASVEALWRRVCTDTNRPLLQVADPRAALRATLERREPLYTAAAHVSVDTSELNALEVARAALSLAVEFFAARAKVAS